MNRPPLLLSRYLSCISCINHVYIYIYFDRFWPSHIILYITIPVVQYIFLSRLCYVYARDILYRLFTVIIIIIIAIQILYLGPVVVNHISIGGGNRYERERERQSSQSARMKPILTVYHYELDIPLNHVEETRSVKQSSKFRPNFPPLSRVFSALYLVFTLVSIIDQLDTGPIQVMVSSSSLIKSNEKRKPRKKKKRKTKNKNDPIMNYYIRWLLYR